MQKLCGIHSIQHVLVPHNCYHRFNCTVGAIFLGELAIVLHFPHMHTGTAMVIFGARTIVKNSLVSMTSVLEISEAILSTLMTPVAGDEERVTQSTIETKDESNWNEIREQLKHWCQLVSAYSANRSIHSKLFKMGCWKSQKRFGSYRRRR